MEQLHNLLVASDRSRLERGSALRVDVGALVEQQLHDLRVTL
jgi:hypothetical protein